MNLARARGRLEKLCVVTLGEAQQMDEAFKAVELGMEEGYWVMLQNCHLTTCWSLEFLQKLEVSDFFGLSFHFM